MYERSGFKVDCDLSKQLRMFSKAAFSRHEASSLRSELLTQTLSLSVIPDKMSKNNY